jgi:hypothetical protein
VMCRVDIYDNIGESNEQNNSREEEVTPPVTALPDLVVTEIVFDQKAGTISYKISNVGDGDTSASFICQLSLDDPFIYEKSEVTATLKAGETRILYYKAIELSLGPQVTVRACADLDDQIKESDEQNNCLEKTLEIPASPPPTPTPTLTRPATLFLLITNGPIVSQVNTDSVIITWTTNLDSDSRVEYDTRSGILREKQTDTQLTREHRIGLQGLAPGTVYRFIVESEYNDGHTVKSRPMTFITSAPADKENPVVSLDLPEKLAGAKAIIEATAKDNTAVSKVTFYIDGKAAFTDYAAPFRWECDTSLFGEGSHSFGARAQDTAGNIDEIARDGEISNHLTGELSPVRVSIRTPSSGEEIYGISSISAEISHDLDLRINRVEFLLDGSVINATDYDPPISLTPVLAPVYITSYRWDTASVGPGSHVINVRVRDEVGNWGSDSRRASTTEPPVPVISVTRDVLRIDNYYEVTLNLRNDGELDVSNLAVADTCRFLQCVRNVLWRRGVSGSFNQLLPAGRVTGDTANRAINTLEVSLGVLRVGETKALRYYAVPVIRDTYDAYLSPEIGTELSVSYETTHGNYTRNPSLAYRCPTLEFVETVRAADYLIITCPARLDDDNPADNTSILLATMAELAKTKNGVLGYVSRARADLGAAAVKMLIQEGGTWSILMAPAWVNSGYLLITGEAEIVPAWDWERIPLSDYPYSDTRGDMTPELRVGRIIGNTASDLTIPLLNSLNGVYNGSQALLVSGPEDTWESNVKNATLGRGAMTAAGLDAEILHTEYFTCDYAMLAEGIRIKKAPQSGTDLRELAIFLLQRLGPPRGAAADEDFSEYTNNEIGTWLLWARHRTPGVAIRNDAIADANAIIARSGGGDGLRGVMWGVMKDTLMKKDTEREFTTKELAAWLLWEELSPRGPITPDTLGSSVIGGVSHRLADMTQLELVAAADTIITGSRLNLAKTRAEAIQASNTSRGGTYSPWSYVYYADGYTAEHERSEAIKRKAAEGNDVIYFYGHGDPGGWCGALTDWIGTGSEVDPMDFGGRNPIMGAFSCLTGYYDGGPQYDSTDHLVKDNPSISEALFRNGAAVYMGATVVMLYSQMDELTSSKLWRYWSSTSSIGDILHSLKVNLISEGEWWYPFVYYYNLYGDPKYGRR